MSIELSGWEASVLPQESMESASISTESGKRIVEGPLAYRVRIKNNSATKPDRDPVLRVWCDEEQTWLLAFA